MDEDLLGLGYMIKPTIHQKPSYQNHEKQSLRLKFTSQGLSPYIAKKISKLVNILNSKIIDMNQLRKCLAQGIPDEAAVIRQYCWKIILGYLPEDKQKWQAVTERQTKTYYDFVNMFLPKQKFQGYPLHLKKDHPRLQQLQSDYAIWQQIQKDTSRTQSQMSFFVTQSQEIMIPFLTSARKEKFKLINGQNQEAYKQFLNNKQKQRKTYRYDYMTRILYIYAKLNPKILYVQGMNQILAPIFYLVNAAKPAHAVEQASCFFMFNSAITDIIQLHIKDLDKSETGIYGKLNDVNQMLLVIQPTIWSRLQFLKIDPIFYCFRWITLLYAQDFMLFDILRIWESIFSSDCRQQYINFFAIAIMVSCKQVILKNDFTFILSYLQNIREYININQVIDIANQLFAQFKNENFKEHANLSKKTIQKKKLAQSSRDKRPHKQKEKKTQAEKPQEKHQIIKKVAVIKNFANYYVDKFL